MFTNYFRIAKEDCLSGMRQRKLDLGTSLLVETCKDVNKNKEDQLNIYTPFTKIGE